MSRSLDVQQRRLLAVKGQVIGRKTLRELTTLMTSDTFLHRHRSVCGIPQPRSTPAESSDSSSACPRVSVCSPSACSALRDQDLRHFTRKMGPCADAVMDSNWAVQWGVRWRSKFSDRRFSADSLKDSVRRSVVVRVETNHQPLVEKRHETLHRNLDPGPDRCPEY